jgi:hypothetical protein
VSDSAPFKIDRLQRIHSDGSVIRVYQVVGAAQFGWDSNRDLPPPDLQLYPSLEAARDAADAGVLTAGHVCDGICYRWRLLG